MSRAEQEAMIEQWTPYARSLANRYAMRNQRWGSFEDFESAAMEGLWKAAQRFQPSKGFKFGTYATWWIKQTLHRYREKMIGVPVHWHRGSPADAELLSRVMRRASLDAPVAGKDGKSNAKLADMVAAKPDDAVAKRHQFPDDFWERVNKWLQPRLQEIIRLRFREDLTLEQAGERLGVTRERIRQLEGKALKMLHDRCDFGDCQEEA